LIWKVYYTTNRVLIYTLRGLGLVTLIVLAIIYKGADGGAITPRWWGILGLIGWAYLYSCVFYQLLRGNKYFLFLMIAVCVAFYALGKLPAIANSGATHWITAQGGNAAHTSIVLCGIVLCLIFFDKTKNISDKMRFLQALAFTAILFIAGYFLRPYFKISKIYATPTWCLYSAAFCTIVFSALYWLIDKRKIQGWTNFFKPAASNPLLTYIIPDIIYYLAGLLGITIVPYFLRSGLPGVLWSAFFAIAVMVIAMLLNKAKLKLQL